MASMKDGKFTNDPLITSDEDGEFKRSESTFRGTIDPDEVEKNRYHLYVSYACPWAHRTMIVRELKMLQEYISVSVTDPYMGARGWTFSHPWDPKYLAEVYTDTDEHYTGKITVPVLWDKTQKTIINNESSEIIRILNSDFNLVSASDIDLYPEDLRSEIDKINDKIYENVNNGVYKTGFASNQEAYEKNCRKLFQTLNELEMLLGQRPFLAGDYATEADIRLFTTLIRFDTVYYSHFKCNLRQIKDYHHLYNYLKSLFQVPEFQTTCHFDHIKQHYYQSHTMLNPSGIIPLGPELDLLSDHDRGEVKFYRTTSHEKEWPTSNIFNPRV